ncbi:hypothetical protein V6N12_068707 [Hibiscus sabdariffa]|uniref:Uncharacterized protein n=1 Tax=Hibiscus sabdariffa TaxID=183260 RepID=A0ABR2FR47_9ROSI
MATTARDSRAQSSAGKVVAVQRTHHVARGKAVGVPISTEKDSVGQDSPVMVSEIKGVHIGGVKNVTSHETMVKTTSNLNSEKHVAVQVRGVEETRVNRNVKGRVLPTSIRGLTLKSGSKVQLGVKGGLKSLLKLIRSMTIVFPSLADFPLWCRTWIKPSMRRHG